MAKFISSLLSKFQSAKLGVVSSVFGPQTYAGTNWICGGDNC